MRLRSFPRTSWLWLPVLLAAGCDTGVPTAPTGAMLLATAEPTRIPFSGTAAITVEAREATGVPVVSGTELRFVTSLGFIDEVASTDRQGVARATLRAEGTAGTATVTVSSGAATVQLPVEIGPPTALFDCTVTERTVIFTDTSSGGPTGWRWDFGDGATSAKTDPVHTYRADDTYVVTLTVAHGGGEDSASRFVSLPGGTCS